MQPAADDPQTRASLDAYQAAALRWLGGGAIAVVLGVLLGAAIVALAGGGTRVPGLGVLVVVLVLVGTAGMVAGVGALVRARRWRRALTTTPWRTGRLRIAGPAIIAFEPAGFDELDPSAEAVHLKLMSTTVWRTRSVQRLDGAEVLAAPVDGREWVLTADGLDTVVGARTARTTGR